MKITKIETLVCNARMRNWVFVKVLTDQPGLYGWGEATLEWHTRAVVGAIEDIASSPKVGSSVRIHSPASAWRSTRMPSRNTRSSRKSCYARSIATAASATGEDRAVN
jgi:L-alanine-DL-glutamate epimerase-like enolase superfamily enzyme